MPSEDGSAMFPDFKELLSALNEHNVRYLVVGGYAVSHHAQPRATKDLDIFVSPDASNALAVFSALARFGAPLEGMEPTDFTDVSNFFRMGAPPMMVDIMPHISGVVFDDAWARHIAVRIDADLIVPFIGRADLVAAKIAAGRPQDLADVAAIEAAQHVSDASNASGE
jgi:hypothetical protein